MITFVLSLVALVVGYFIYGRIVERVFAPDDRPTPAVSMADGVDYVVLPGWKIFMIQFLNIAGTGPIFGAIMGAKFGPSAYLWIVFGCIFAGAVHDYLSGMLSQRHGDYVGAEVVFLGISSYLVAPFCADSRAVFQCPRNRCHRNLKFSGNVFHRYGCVLFWHRILFYKAKVVKTQLSCLSHYYYYIVLFV